MSAAASLAGLGWRAVSGAPLVELLQEATTFLLEELAVAQVDILERVPDGVRVRAGCGPATRPLGSVVPLVPGSWASMIFELNEPVVTNDAANETRFPPSERLLSVGMAAGMAVPIPGEGGAPYGFIGVHSAERRDWTAEDIDLVRNVAHIAGGAIARRRQALELNDDVLQALVIIRYALEHGRVDTARETLDAALARAREMVSALLGAEGADGEAMPGDLRRA